MKTKTYVTLISIMLVVVNLFAVTTLAQEENENEIQWPSSWILIDTDPMETSSSGDDYRDVKNASYNVDNEYLYFRLECYGTPNFTAEPEGRYKWFIDIDDPHNMGQSGGNVFDAEYMLFVEDSPKPGGDGIGDVYLLEDLNDDGFIGDDYIDYLSSPGKVNDSEIASYRIEGNCIDLCIKLTAISNPTHSYFTWATDQENPNLDQAPTTDRSDNYWNTDLAKADVSIIKTDSTDPVYPGDSFTYSLLVTNHGPHVAENIIVTDEIPSELIFNSATPTESGGTLPNLYWNIPSLSVGQSCEIIVDVAVSSSFTGVISNTAYALNGTRDPVAGNNHDAEETTVIQTADLSITKTDSADPVYPGDSFNYVLHVENNGIYTAENVVVVDSLPAGLSFVSASPAPSDISGSTLTWNLGSLAVDGSIDITLEVLADNIASTTVINNAEVTSDTFDPAAENNMASESTTIGSAADLSISKSSDSDLLYHGDSLTYTVVVTNNGPDSAVNVNISDVLPAGLSFVSASPAPSGSSGSNYFWNFASIENGQSETIEIDVLVGYSALGIVTNTAEVTSDTFDPASENNMASKSVTVEYSSDLSIEKTSEYESPAHAGSLIVYTINVTNHGPDMATSINVTDLLPDGLTFNESIPVADEVNGREYKWHIDSIDAGESVIIKINVTVNESYCGTITNTATVEDDSYDPDNENDEDDEEIQVVSISDLSIDKTSEYSQPVYAGDQVIYYLNVTNHGPDVAEDVNVTDILPSGVTFIDSNMAPNGSNGQTYYWIISSMEVNESVVIRVNVTVNEGFSGTIINTATVEDDSYDPDDSDDSDDEEITVDEEDDDDDTGDDGGSGGGGGGSGGSNDNPPSDDGGSGGGTPAIQTEEPTAEIDGPDYALIDEEVQFNATESHDNDEDGESIERYDWKFFDEDEWHNGTGAAPTYTYPSPGLYNVSVRVFDNENTSDINTTSIIIGKPNSPPGQPDVNGPTNGTQNVSYNFTIVSTDDDGDDIKYVIDWGDGNTTESGFLPSGQPFTTSYKWKDPGEYKVKFTADDNSTVTDQEVDIEIKEPEPDKQKADDGSILWPLLLLILLFLGILLYLVDRRRRGKSKDAKNSKAPAAKQSAKPKPKAKHSAK